MSESDHEVTAGIGIELAAADSKSPPSVIQLMPIGESIASHDGRHWKNSAANAKKVVEESLKGLGGLDMVIDYHHQEDNQPASGGPVPAAGWMSGLRIEDGFIVADVEWTERAAELISNREYRYISPTFLRTGTDKGGRVIRILRAALVNAPAFDMPALARSETGESQMKGKMTDKAMRKILSKLNLTMDSSDTDVDAALSKMEGHDKKGMAASICEALGLEADKTDEATLAAAVTALKVKADAAGASADDERIAALEQTNVDLAKQLTELRTARTEDAAEAAVTAAIEAGKITPAQKVSMMSMYRHDAKAFAEFVEAAPVIVKAGEEYQKGSEPGSETLTELETATCRKLNITQAEFIAARDGKPMPNAGDSKSDSK